MARQMNHDEERGTGGKQNEGEEKALRSLAWDRPTATIRNLQA